MGKVKFGLSAFEYGIVDAPNRPSKPTDNP